MLRTLGFGFCCLLFALLERTASAADPGERTFTALGGGQIGAAGNVGAKGNLSEVLPLVLPSPRGGLPMPFAVAYNGSNVVGAAGMGWDIPIAGVTWQHNLSRRKPVHRFAGAVDPTPADRIFVDIGSGPMLMAATDAAGVYQPFANGYYELRVVGAGLTGRDGSGRRWIFQKIPALLDDDFFALTTIVDSTGKNRVDFRYDVFDKFSQSPVQVPFSPTDVSMRELVLREITHTYVAIPTGPTPVEGHERLCPKYRITLDYATWQGLNYPVEYPNLLSVDFAAGRPRAHTRLVRSIKVRSNISPFCQSLILPVDRTYVVAYAADALTKQPRLQKVDWFGRNDPATNAASALPVVAYEYGSPLVSGGLQFANAEQFTLPSGPAGTTDGFAASLGTGGGAIYGLVRGFQDFDGDGRADFVTLDSTGQKPLLTINRASNQGNDFSTFPGQVILPNTPAAPYSLGTPDFLFGLPVLETLDNTYQQVIDFNGDGRQDILIATEGRNAAGERDPNYWKLLLNTPGPTGLASDIRWLERQIEVTDLRSAIASRHVLSLTSSSDQKAKVLPLARTCQVGAFAQNVSVESGTLTQWKLIDVNGDGFPDMVFDSQDVTAFNDTSCDLAGNCQNVLRQDHPPTTRLMVMYHTGLMMAGSGADTQSVWRGPAVLLRSDGACGVERMKWLGGGMRRLSCGFMEANGDGIADYVIQDAGGIRAIRSSGLAEAHDVRLPENHLPGGYALQEKKRAILLPGPVGLVKDPRTTVCGSNGNSTQPYAIEQQTALRDVTGDGIADYVYFGTRDTLTDGTSLLVPSLKGGDQRGPQAWWVMPGTGVGFGAPLSIRTTGIPFAIHTTAERCNGQISNVTATLQDLDGDGRPEIVRAGRLSSVTIAKLVNAAGQLGAHSSGQLTAIDNRYGSVTRVSYGSAKANWISPGHNPASEIVVTQTERTAERGLSNGLAPVRYAYGNPEIIYHSALGRWVFTGYRRRVVSHGETTNNPAYLTGRATVLDSVAVAESTGELAQIMMSGRPRDENTVASKLLPTDPRFLLVDSAALPKLANDHVSWKAQALPGTLPFLVPLEEECYSTPPPQTPGIFGDLVMCRRAVTPYVGEQTSWEGSHPYPAVDAVATRTIVNAVDGYARPKRITSEGDRFRTDDDLCVQIDYASTANGAPVYLNAPHTVRTSECGNASAVLSGARYLYDGLPEGQVSAGFVSGQILERHDVQAGALLDQAPTATIDRDGYGNPVQFTRTRPDGATNRTTVAYDPFGIVPVRTETTATGLAQPLVREVERDSQTLLPMVLWNQNRTATYNTFDNFGRLVRVSLALPNDPIRYVLTETTFTGFEGGIVPRSVRYRAYSQWTPVGNIAAADPKTINTYTEALDEMGRLINGIVDLGGDYNGQSLIVNSTIYDSLGRPKFEADPFSSVGFGSHYGVTLSYREDGRPSCAIEGQGLQTLATTDPSSDRYPTCMSYRYSAHQALTKTQGPSELAIGKPESGAYDEEALGATGLVLRRTRVKAGVTLAQAEYNYDRLGQLSSLTRFANPQSGTGAVTWSWSNDSFGKTLTATEPAGVSRTYKHDAWGNVSSLRWMDSSVERAVNFSYDGLSRLVSITATANGVEQPGTSKEYFYDKPSGQAQHLDTQFLLGKLAWARAGGRNIFLGYDALGRLTTKSQGDANDPESFAERQTLGPLGEVARLDLLLPGTGTTPEKIAYEYDSARHMKVVRFSDAAGTNELWRAMQTDIFGRLVQAKLGNGATQTFTYRPDHRRELTQTRTAFGTKERVVSYGTYDGDMLLQNLTEVNNLGPSSTSTTTSYTYDARSALQRATVQSPSGVITDLRYAYDGLGNLKRIVDGVGTSGRILRADLIDRDRLCSVARAGSHTAGCDYRYDSLGNVQAADGAAYQYQTDGKMSAASKGARRIDMTYDPFGAMSSLRSKDSTLQRVENFYGSATSVSFFNPSGQPISVGVGTDAFQSFLERRIQSPAGTIAVVRKANTGAKAILYPIGENQGTRTVLGDNGLSQEISYDPYGKVVSDSQAPQSLTFWPYQWNGGHTLDDLGLVAVGQRVLDSSTGRFLQRDPVINFTSATTAHPYAFAWDNPVGFTDRTGADPASDAGGVANGLAAVGKALYQVPVPGATTDPYVQMDWACGKDHDCMSAVESAYGLTEYEKGLRSTYHSGSNKPRSYQDYHVVMDRLSGAVLGYAFFDNNVTIYDRNGKVVATLGNERALETPFLDPTDLAGGFLAGPLRSALGRIAIRGGEAAAESALAQDALEGAAGMAKKPSTYQPFQNLGSVGLTSWSGQIYIDAAIKQGSAAFDSVFRHETMHWWLTPTEGLFVGARQGIRKWFYLNSHLLRFGEEALAEGYSTRSVIKGLAWPFVGGYGINPARLVLEGGLFAGSLYGSFRLGQEIRGQWDSH